MPVGLRNEPALSRVKNPNEAPAENVGGAVKLGRRPWTEDMGRPHGEKRAVRLEDAAAGEGFSGRPVGGGGWAVKPCP